MRTMVANLCAAASSVLVFGILAIAPPAPAATPEVPDLGGESPKALLESMARTLADTSNPQGWLGFEQPANRALANEYLKWALQLRDKGAKVTELVEARIGKMEAGMVRTMATGVNPGVQVVLSSQILSLAPEDNDAKYSSQLKNLGLHNQTAGSSGGRLDWSQVKIVESGDRASVPTTIGQDILMVKVSGKWYLGEGGGPVKETLAMDAPGNKELTDQLLTVLDKLDQKVRSGQIKKSNFIQEYSNLVNENIGMGKGTSPGAGTEAAEAASQPAGQQPSAMAAQDATGVASPAPSSPPPAPAAPQATPGAPRQPLAAVAPSGPPNAAGQSGMPNVPGQLAVQNATGQSVVQNAAGQSAALQGGAAQQSLQRLGAPQAPAQEAPAATAPAAQQPTSAPANGVGGRAGECINTLTTGDDRSRQIAAGELKRYNMPAVVSALISAVQNDGSPNVRKEAANSLGHLHARDALPVLNQVSRSDSDKSVRKAALKAVETIEGVSVMDKVKGVFSHD